MSCSLESFGAGCKRDVGERGRGAIRREKPVAVRGKRSLLMRVRAKEDDTFGRVREDAS